MEMKKHLAQTIGISFHYVDIVCLEDGVIYENDRHINGISRPLQVMVGNPQRKIPRYLVTPEPDMIYQDVNDEELRLKMSCGHAITPDNLFGHMKHTLMSEVKPSVNCLTKNCGAEWSMQEIIKKADMTEDERIFFEWKISFNLINQEVADTSECPFCGSFCQRQQNTLPTRCSICTRKNGTACDFCWSCKSPWIVNHKCSNRELEAIQKMLNDAPLKTIDMSHIEGVPSKRMCPGCQCLIEHRDACKTMTCTKCKTVFCFVCLKVAIKGQLQCGSYNQKCEVAPVQRVL